VMQKKIDGRHEGFGDTIKAFTSFTRIDKFVENITNGNCGCDERQEWLNKKIPYKK
jgi:hypothetical protein